jgi:hypothetical protein
MKGNEAARSSSRGRKKRREAEAILLSALRYRV